MALIGTPIHATAPGKVVFAEANRTFGDIIEIAYGCGPRTRYSNPHRNYVKSGQPIANWQEIGLLGNSGRMTEPHVYYEVRKKGNAKNPIKFMEAGDYLFKE